MTFNNLPASKIEVSKKCHGHQPLALLFKQERKIVSKVGTLYYQWQHNIVNQSRKEGRRWLSFIITLRLSTKQLLCQTIHSLSKMQKAIFIKTRQPWLKDPFMHNMYTQYILYHHLCIRNTIFIVLLIYKTGSLQIYDN